MTGPIPGPKALWDHFLGSDSPGKQLLLWVVFGEIIRSLGQPVFTDLQHATAAEALVEALSPAEMATAVNRGFKTEQEGAAEAAYSGISAERFTTLTDLAGDAPGPAELAEAYRRKLIPKDSGDPNEPSLFGGIRQGNLRNMWAPMMEQLSVLLPSFDDAIQALVESQLTEAEARDWYAKAGGDPAAFDWLFGLHGEAPGPVELGLAANRGIIGWNGVGPHEITFEQGIHEGRARNKWEPVYRELAVYHPPPRTVTALLRAGTITQARALELFKQAGLSAELAAAYVADAAPHHSVTGKELSQGRIVTLYHEHLLTKAEAHGLLVKEGWDAHTADVLLTEEDLKRQIATINAAVTAIRTRYVGRKINKAATVAALGKLGIASGDVAALVQTWDVERTASVKKLTEAQVIKAWNAHILTTDETVTELTEQGYSAFDAWVLMELDQPGQAGPKPALAV